MSRRAPRATSVATREGAPTRTTSSTRARAEHPRTIRAPRRATKVLVTIGVVVTVLAVGGQWALHSSYLRVQHVTIIGEVHESAEQVIEATGLDNHPTMLSVSSRTLAHDLSAFSWIKTVSLRKHWPNSITLRVHELRPVAVAYGPQHQLRFVSAGGRDLGAAPLNANYPTLVYVKPLRSTWPFSHAGQSAARVASELPVAFSAQVSSITVGASGAVTLQMTTPVTFVLGEPTELRQKFVAIASVIAHSTLVPGDVVDVSVPDELAVSGPARS
jgi:cell division septal protein FtsQ